MFSHKARRENRNFTENLTENTEGIRDSLFLCVLCGLCVRTGKASDSDIPENCTEISVHVLTYRL